MTSAAFHPLSPIAHESFHRGEETSPSAEVMYPGSRRILTLRNPGSAGSIKNGRVPRLFVKWAWCEGVIILDKI